MATSALEGGESVTTSRGGSLCECENPVCSQCGKLCSASSSSPRNVIIREARDLIIADHVITINDQPSDKEDSVSQLTKLPSGDLLISTAKNVTLTQRHTVITVQGHLPVKMHVATDLEEIGSVGDRVMVLKSDWGEEKESALNGKEGSTVIRAAEREVIVTKFLTEHTEELYTDVIKELQKENIPEELLNTLFHRFHLRLLGLTKRVEFLMEVDASHLHDVLKQEPEVHKVLSQLVPPQRRPEVTWAAFSHLPVQCIEEQQTGAKVARRRYTDDEEQSAEQKDFMTMTTRRVFSSNPATPKDKSKPFITAIVSTQDNRLVIADYNNKTVKVLGLTPPYRVYASIELTQSPFRLALLHDGLIAATTTTNTIYLLNVDDQVDVKAEFQTLATYCGIAGNSLDDTLFVSCSANKDARVDVVTREGNVVRTVLDASTFEGLRSPRHICLENGHILVSDNLKDAVYIVDLGTGQVVDTLTHEDMKRPSQVAVDRAGNVYVACFGSQCVLVRSINGEWRRLLCGTEHSEVGYDYACGVCVTSLGIVVAWDQGSCDFVLIGYGLMST